MGVPTPDKTVEDGPNTMRKTLCLLFVPMALMAQSGDSETLRAILEEIRQLRQDFQGMTFVAQRVQILLHRIQRQEGLLNAARLRHAEADMKLGNARRMRSETAEALEELELSLASEQNAQHRAVLEGQQRELERILNMWTREEPQLRADEVDASNELSTELATLDELRDRLDRLDRQLEAYGTTAPAH